MEKTKFKFCGGGAGYRMQDTGRSKAEIPRSASGSGMQETGYRCRPERLSACNAQAGSGDSEKRSESGIQDARYRRPRIVPAGEYRGTIK